MRIGFTRARIIVADLGSEFKVRASVGGGAEDVKPLTLACVGARETNSYLAARLLVQPTGPRRCRGPRIAVEEVLWLGLLQATRSTRCRVSFRLPVVFPGDASGQSLKSRRRFRPVRRTTRPRSCSVRRAPATGASAGRAGSSPPAACRAP